MERKRNEKLLALLALCVAVVGLTLGFAAFSNTLTISSSATVTPDASDFKLKMYGLPQNYSHEDLSVYDQDIVPLGLYSSTTVAGASIEGLENNTVDAELATIDNENLVLKGLNAKFTVPDDYVNYVVVLKNEGKYDAYINMAEIVMPTKTCTPGEGTSANLVAKACEKIYFLPMIGYYDETTGKVDWDASHYIIDEKGNLKIAVGEYVYMMLQIAYDDDYGETPARADGPFDVSWSDFKVKFSTAA